MIKNIFAFLGVVSFMLFLNGEVAAQLGNGTATCSDTLGFTRAKASGTQFVTLNGKSDTAFAQYFDGYGQVTIPGFRFYAYKPDTIGGITHSALAEVYEAGSDSLPTGAPLASRIVNIDTTFGSGTLNEIQRMVIFLTSAVSSGPYVLVLSTTDTTDLFVAVNDYTAATPDGNQEWLASAAINGNWERSYDVQFGANVFDGDLLFEPIASFEIFAGIGTSPNCLIGTDTVVFVQTGSPYFLSRMYNQNVFNNKAFQSFRWDFGDATPEVFAINPTHIYNNPSLPITASVVDSLIGWTNKCAVDTNYTFPGSPTAGFTFLTNGLQVGFTDQSSSYTTNWLWDFGDGTTSALQNPNHFYSIGGMYEVCLIASNTCGADTTCHDIITLQNPPPGACGIDTVLYTSAKSTSIQGFTLDTINTSAVAQYFDTPDPISVYGFRFYAGKQNIINGVVDTLLCSIYAADTDSLPMGAPIASVKVPVDTVTGALPGFAWEQRAAIFNAPVTMTQPYLLVLEYTGANLIDMQVNNWMATPNGDGDGEWLASLKESGTWRRSYQVVKNNAFFDGDILLEPFVHYFIQAGFNVSTQCLVTGTGNQNVNFQNTSSAIIQNRMYSKSFFNGQGVFQFTWDFGDQSPLVNALNVTHTFPGAANFTSELDINMVGWTSSCTADTALTFNVTNPMFFTTSVASFNVTYTNLSGQAGPYYWDHGDGTKDTFALPSSHTHVYQQPGNYYVCLKAMTPCGFDSVCDTIPLGCPNPLADFTFEDTLLTVTFQDSSIGWFLKDWYWDFGDSTTDSSMNPVHTYATGGTYNVCLTVTDSCTTHTKCQQVTVDCPQGAILWYEQSNNLAVDFTAVPIGQWALGYQWDFGDGNTSTQMNPSHLYDTAGDYNVCLIYIDSCFTDTLCDTVSLICPVPTADFSFTSSNAIASFSDMSIGTGPLLYTWDFGDSTGDSVSNPVHIFPSVGTYTVCLTVMDSCYWDSICKTVTLSAPCSPPTAGFTETHNILTVNFTDTSNASVQILGYQWDFGDGNTSTQQNPTHTYSTSAVYTACLTVFDSCGTDTQCMTLTLICTDPIANFGYTANNINYSFVDSSVTSLSQLSWQWDFGDGSTSTQQNPSHTFPGQGDYEVCLIINDSCASDTTCDSITVTCPTPTANWGVSTTNLDATFSDSSVAGLGIISRLWDFGDGTTSTASNPAHTYAIEGSYIVCLSIVDSCSNDTMCDTVNIVCPLPVAGWTHTDTLYDVYFSDTSQAGNGITGWLWDFGDGVTDTNQNPMHVFAGVGNHQVCLTVFDTCGQDSACKTIVVTCPDPVADFTSTTNLDTAFFSDNSTTSGAAVSWFWDFGDGNVSGQQNPAHNYVNSGIYTVCLVVFDTCAIDTTCKTVLINCPNPTASFTHSANFLAVTFTDASTGNSISQWDWDFGDGNNSTLQNPVHAYATGGTYTVCLTVVDVCDTASVCNSVSVSCPTPSSDFNFTTSALGAFFTDNSTANGIQSWSWNFGDGNTDSVQNPNHIYAANGSYSVCLTIIDSCGTDVTCKVVTVACVDPTAGFDTTINSLQVTFTDTTVGVGVSNWQWDFGDGSTDSVQNPTHLFPGAGTYNVCLVVSDSCGIDTACKSVTITCPAPTANFGFVANDVTVTFSDSATAGLKIQSYLWDFGDGTTDTAQNPVHLFPSSGTYNVCQIVLDSCTNDTFCDSITLTCPGPSVAFTTSTSNTTVTFTDGSSPGLGIISYKWYFGDGDSSSAQNPTHFYPSTGTYTACLVIHDTCNTDSVCQNITLSCALPTAAFTSSATSLNVSFFDGSTGGVGLTGWSWDFGDGNTSTFQNPSHVYGAAGTYTVCLVAFDQCGTDTVCDTITVTCPPPNPLFTSNINSLTANFTDISTAGLGIQGWLWDFGDGNTDSVQNPTHVYATAGTYTVCLTVFDSCITDSNCEIINVICPLPTANFNSSTSFLTATFTDATTPGNGITSWLWIFGDGDSATSQNPVHAYPAAGTYTVCLEVLDSCGGDTICKSVSISCPSPTAGFTHSSTLLTTTFTDASTAGGQLLGWQWDFGDGNNSTQQSPNHTYASSGTYTVCLTALDTCGSDTSCQSVTVSCPGPTAAFTSSTNNLIVTFTDGSTVNGGTTYSWAFGDGNTSNQQDPVHTYPSGGVYTICLTVTDACGSNTKCQAIAIVCPPVNTDFTFTSTLTTANFTDNSAGTGISGWSWTFGDGGTSNVQNPTHVYSGAGTYTVCLTATDSCGSKTKCKTIPISCPNPTAAFTHSSTLLTATFADASTGNSFSGWTWDFGDGNTSNQQNPTHVYSTAGTYTVCLTVNDLCGSNQKCNSVTITCPPPNSNFSFSTSQLTATFTNSSTGNSPFSYLWNFGDGSTDTTLNTSHSYSSSGTYTACLTVTDLCNTDSTCKTVTLTCNNPTANFTFSSSLLNATFTNTSSVQGATTYLWNFGDGNTDTAQNPVHQYSASGGYNVCLTVTDGCGTDTKCNFVPIICPPPNANFSTSTSLLTATFTDLSSGNTINSWSWDFGDGQTSTGQNPAHTYAAPGTYQVCLTINDTCGNDQVCKNIVVNCSAPTTNFGHSTNFLTATFSDSSTANYTITSWFWAFGDGNTSSQQNPVHNYQGTGSYSVCLTTTDSCGSNTVCKTVVVSCNPPTANFGFNAVLGTVTFSDSSTGNGIGGHFWDFGDGDSSSVQNPVKAYSSSGVYNVCLSVSDSCSTATICKTVTINCPPPATTFTYGISSLTATFNNGSSGNFISGYLWDFGDGNTDTVTNPVHVFGSQGNYLVCLTAFDTCGSDSSCELIKIVCPPPSPDYSFSNNLLTVSFSDLTTGSGITGWHWDFGDGDSSIAQNPTHTYQNGGIYKVCLTVTNNCGSITICKNITVVCPSPAPDFSFVVNNLTVNFTNGSFGNGITTWQWDFGDGGSSNLQNPVHVYSQSGTFQVCLTITDQCGSATICKTVLPGCTKPAANFNTSVTGLTVNFTDASTGVGVSSWFWDFGDGAKDSTQNPSHTYVTFGLYNVCVIVTGTCGKDTICKNVQVGCAPPVAAFTSADTGLTVTFTDLSTGSSINSWFWNFGDGNISFIQNPSYTYQQKGSYNVCLTITDSCGSDTICDSLTVDTLIARDELLPVDAVKAFPNPTNGQINLQVDLNQTSELSIRLMDMHGRVLRTMDGLVVRKKLIPINLEPYADGIYFLEVRTELGKWNLKVQLTR